MIIVLGHVDIAPSDIAAFCHDIEKIDPAQNTESGCISYSVAVANPARGRLHIAERWHNQPALNAHLQRPETQAFIKNGQGEYTARFLNMMPPTNARLAHK